MQEIIDEIVKAVDASDSEVGIHMSDLRKRLHEILPPATIHPAQFVNGEPTEDGEYVCRCEAIGGVQWQIVYRKHGECWNKNGIGLTKFYPRILSHCKLP